MKIYDPRLGEDFVFNDRHLKRTFSSLQHGLYVVDGGGSRLLDEQATLLKTCVERTSSLGFAILAPWSPGAKKLRNRITEVLDSVSEFEGSVIGYFTVQNVNTVDMLLDLRAASGADRSGEWGFGGCVGKFSSPKRLPATKGELWNFVHVLAQAEKLGCFLYRGDGFTTFMTKSFPSLDVLLGKTSFLKQAERGRSSSAIDQRGA